MRFNLFIATFLVFSLNSSALTITTRSELSDNNPLTVTAIDLSNSGLSEFPMDVLKCKNLESLDLSDNGIINIPVELGQLKHLKKISFSGNQGLSYVDFDKLLELAEFELTELDISNCEMGFTPNQIGRQKQLKQLDVSGNLLSSLPFGLIQLSELEVLNASGNWIGNLSWQVTKLWSLRELDVSANPDLEMEELLLNLSMGNALDKLIISDLIEIPRSLKDLDVKELEIRNSKIDQFLRTEYSSPIHRLSFVNCSFANPEKVVETINDHVKPNFIGLRGIGKSDLAFFLKVKTDSVDIRNNGLTDIRQLMGVRQLKWVDARGNRISANSKNELIKNRPDLELLIEEPLKENKGVVPPIPQFVQEPIIEQVTAGNQASVSIGRSTFEIPENAFLDASGNIYEGKVELNYTEYFEPAEIFLSGITMTSDSLNENLIFSSGGMFNLTATDNKGNELKMNPEGSVKVSMMSSDANPNMNLYRLDENGVWQYIQNDTVTEPFKIDMAAVDSAANAAFMNYRRDGIIITENKFVPVVRNDDETRSFTFTFNEYETNPGLNDVEKLKGNLLIKKPKLVSSFIGASTFVFDGSLDSMKYYKKWFKKVQRKSRKAYKKIVNETSNGLIYSGGINYITNLNVKLDKEKDRLRLNFMYKDSAVSVPVVLQSSPSNLNARKRMFQQFFKKYDRFMRKDESMRRKQNRVASLIMKRQEDEIKQLAITREKMRQELYYENREFFQTMVDGSSVQRSFSLIGFGVWNCDQRQRMSIPQSLPRDFVAASDGSPINDIYEKIYVIDYNRNGVVSFGNQEDAFFDKASGRTAIVVFFSAVTVGVFKTWKNEIVNSKSQDAVLPLQRLNIENMNVGTFTDFLNN